MCAADVARFWAKVRKTDGCWLWTASLNSTGYGQMWVNGKNWRAHRLSRLIAGRPLPDDQVARHTCHTPMCVNPDYIVGGTQRDNIHDAVAAGRLSCGERHGRTCRGERHHSARLSARDVVAIRYAAAMFGVSWGKIADAYGVYKATVGDILRGRTWSSAAILDGSDH